MKNHGVRASSGKRRVFQFQRGAMPPYAELTPLLRQAADHEHDPISARIFDFSQYLRVCIRAKIIECADHLATLSGTMIEGQFAQWASQHASLLITVLLAAAM
ncbi:hypothetical protein O0880_20870 [Janthinobacterium sp. SUN118]|uniref:hypothetical protein n=1 Tax=Janthinobacterium sp. SUN118 TaxID=3004100 RepID=UPI0025B13797|nr:hypothetical protein [Janthinobacterium sp. SUN118]MDN2711881.1 hypothetical protein [Janthinobacterium sp. SUN118]